MIATGPGPTSEKTLQRSDLARRGCDALMEQYWHTTLASCGIQAGRHLWSRVGCRSAPGTRGTCIWCPGRTPSTHGDLRQNAQPRCSRGAPPARILRVNAATAAAQERMHWTRTKERSSQRKHLHT